MRKALGPTTQTRWKEGPDVVGEFWLQTQPSRWGGRSPTLLGRATESRANNFTAHEKNTTHSSAAHHFKPLRQHAVGQIGRRIADNFPPMTTSVILTLGPAACLSCPTQMFLMVWPMTCSAFSMTSGLWLSSARAR